MRKSIPLLFLLLLTAVCSFSQPADSLKKYSSIVRKSVFNDYKGMYKEAGGALPFPFITPGSSQYSAELWDWDSWLSNIALRQILLENGSATAKTEAVQFEQGCILNFLQYGSIDGWLPISITRSTDMKVKKPKDIYLSNMHKPCLAQHAAFLTQLGNGKADWLGDKFYFLQTFVNNYVNHHRHPATGLYYWQNDNAIGVDNDPCTFYRPARSSGSIYLNCLMYKELKAMAYLCRQLGLVDTAPQYEANANALKEAIQKHCWDEKDGFFYSVDLNLLPLHTDSGFVRHSGMPRDYDCLIQRIGVWSGFMALWAGIATPAQAERMVRENLLDTKTFNAPYGVRSLSKLEKMYNLKATGNPSSWLGPIWGVSNYMTWRGLVQYGYEKEARELAYKTVLLFGRDLEKTGVLHEYYEPETGTPVLNPGFQNWNYLVINMLAWMDGRQVISEF